MNEKEIAELRRRLKTDKCAVDSVSGCFVNDKKEIVSTFRLTLGMMGKDDSDALLSVMRKVLSGKYKLSIVHTDNPRVLLKDRQVLDIEGIRVEALLVPGHTWGHMVYLVDDAYLFTGDTLWFGADGGYSFINILAEDNELAKRSLEALEKELRTRDISPKIITGHTGWTDSLDFAFAHRDKVCNGRKKQEPHDPKAPYDGYDERDDTEENARTVPLVKQDESLWRESRRGLL